MTAPVLRVQDLCTLYQTPDGPVRAVDQVSLALEPGQRYGLIGESGSGKSTLALSLLRLIRPPGIIASGEIWLGDKNVLALTEEQMRQTRLSDISLVAQGSMNSLNPVLKVQRQIVDGIRNHDSRLSRNAEQARVNELLLRVGLRPEVANMYPHELSGGMKQRVCIAIAISLRPKVIIADEPTSALDVVVQMQVMETLRLVQEEVGAAIFLIGHDIGLMAQFVDRVGIMYAGKLIEEGPIRDVLLHPHHPYTQMLIESIPSLTERRDLQGIAGVMPSLLDLPSGCAFHPRCPFVQDSCKSQTQALQSYQPHRQAACQRVQEIRHIA